MRHILLAVLFTPLIILFSCFSSRTTDNRLQGDNEITRDNYYDYFVKKPGLILYHLQETEVLDIIYSELNKRGFTIDRCAVFEFEDHTVVPINGYLSKLNVGFFLNSGWGEPTRNGRTHPDCVYFKYTPDGKHHMMSFKPTAKNLVVFQNDWYWYEEWSSNEYKEENAGTILVSKEKISQILKDDIALYFDPLLKTIKDGKQK